MPPITPTEKITIDGVPVFIKREDQYTAPIPTGAIPHKPGAPPPPPFAKPRGLVTHLRKLKQQGIKNVGYMDTAISMSGWAVAYYAPLFGLNPIIFVPNYKDGYRYNTARHLGYCIRLGAEVFDLDKPAQISINHHRASKIVLGNYGNAAMLPQGLPFDDTVVSVAKEISLLPKAALGGTIVIAIGSGTMAAGVITGLINNKVKQKVVGVLVSKKDVTKMHRAIMIKAHGIPKFAFMRHHVSIVQGPWDYLDVPDIKSPFPCNPNYDLKAWAWLMDNVQNLQRPILFWNIGA